MRIKSAIGLATVLTLPLTTNIGCGDGGNTPVADAPALKPAETQPLPKSVKKGGGSGSSGNMNRNPGASN